jgi:dienelactone hydrolase
MHRMLTQIRIDNLCNVLATAKKSFDIRVYADAPHGFLNDTMLGHYRASQA